MEASASQVQRVRPMSPAQPPTPVSPSCRHPQPRTQTPSISSRVMAQVLELQHPRRRPGRKSCLPASTWPSADPCRHLASESADGKSISFFLSVVLCFKQMKLIKHKHYFKMEAWARASLPHPRRGIEAGCRTRGMLLAVRGLPHLLSLCPVELCLWLPELLMPLC